MRRITKSAIRAFAMDLRAEAIAHCETAYLLPDTEQRKQSREKGKSEAKKEIASRLEALLA